MDSELNLIRMNRTAREWFPDEVPCQGRKCYEFFHGRVEPTRCARQSERSRRAERAWR
jgi:hypothetical protein